MSLSVASSPSWYRKIAISSQKANSMCPLQRAPDSHPSPRSSLSNSHLLVATREQTLSRAVNRPSPTSAAVQGNKGICGTQRHCVAEALLQSQLLCCHEQKSVTRIIEIFLPSIPSNLPGSTLSIIEHGYQNVVHSRLPVPWPRAGVRALCHLGGQLPSEKTP